MFKLVTEQMGQEAIVVDADDLLKHPGNGGRGGFGERLLEGWSGEGSWRRVVWRVGW